MKGIMKNARVQNIWRTALAASLLIGSAGLAADPATAAGGRPDFIPQNRVVPLIGMPFAGAELRMGAPGDFSGCERPTTPRMATGWNGSATAVPCLPIARMKC